MGTGNLKEEIKSLVPELLIGVASVEDIPSEYLYPEIRKVKYPRAISLAYPLLPSVLETIENEPTLIYKHHYKVVNWLLDQAAHKIAYFLCKKGYDALPIAASQTVDWEVQRGHISHRFIAHKAGLGWIGKSGLLVNPQYGPRIRLATIFTSAPLEPDSPYEGECGDCKVCIEACPAGALSDNGYDKEKCLQQLKKFASKRGIGVLICGVCVKVCPVGRQE
ncbi:hypothetical protein DRQ20_00600 [bacterium]|nr:MAG: hypothetical protein DRQ20_00600 [bacterium]